MNSRNSTAKRKDNNTDIQGEFVALDNGKIFILNKKFFISLINFRVYTKMIFRNMR